MNDDMRRIARRALEQAQAGRKDYLAQPEAAVVACFDLQRLET